MGVLWGHVRGGGLEGRGTLGEVGEGNPGGEGSSDFFIRGKSDSS